MTGIDPHAEAMRAYYGRGEEQTRLEQGHGLLEFERTIEILSRHLPDPPARVADVGGGPGRYALWLAERGYEIEHRDLIGLHVEQLKGSLKDGHRVNTAVGDARALTLPDESVDGVLLLGPLYHIAHHQDRVTALREARRILTPGGVVFAAAISRWAVRLDGSLRLRGYRDDPAFERFVTESERSGSLPPIKMDGFTAVTHRPDDLAAEIMDAGLRLADLVGLEGPAGFFPDVGERMCDDEDRRAVLDSARALERIPEVIGASPHLLAVATRDSPDPGAAAAQP
ncbi:MAG TPA: class I SAM-dependent methyltransferase [Solirubrobacteraceae bacterium]|nr:class I SAM-dependent methyltransferase [Solirubrobacteraceae bacterium]